MALATQIATSRLWLSFHVLYCTTVLYCSPEYIRYQVPYSEYRIALPYCTCAALPLAMMGVFERTHQHTVKRHAWSCDSDMHCKIPRFINGCTYSSLARSIASGEPLIAAPFLACRSQVHSII